MTSDDPANASDLIVRREADGDDLTVTVVGDVDLATAPVLATALEAAVTDAVARVAVDLAAVEYLDSSGVHAVLEAYDLARRNDKQLRLVNVRRNVRRVLEITGVAALVEPDGDGPDHSP